jgi:ribonuclease VapC
MYVDASAIVAILNREPEAAALKLAFDANSAKAFVSPLTIFEATISLARAKVFARDKNRKPSRADIDAAHKVVRAFLEANGVKEIPVLADVGRLAIEAAATYGKAVGHPADLNFGDCFVYACAKSYRAPLLFKGDDFTKTDIQSVLVAPPA